MARPVPPPRRTQAVSGNTGLVKTALASSSSVYHPQRRTNPQERDVIAKRWQTEAYRHVNICGEARYAVNLFAATAGRAEIGISEPQSLARKPVWIKDGPEVDDFAELAPNVRARSKLIRDFMVHWIIAGETWLIARDRVDTDPGADDGNPVWEFVAVTELRKVGDLWSVRHDNGNYVDLDADAPIIRVWNPDPADRREAWSPFRSLLSTLKEIEWLTAHIFTQVRSRLMSAGVWFLPDNLTFAPPPPDAVEGGAEAIAQMNEAEQFMVSLAASAMQELDGEEVAFPSVVLADPAALAEIDQNKLIKFWSDIDDKAMSLRSDAVRRFALGMDLPPEQVLGASGVAVTNSGGSAGSSNHWSLWAIEEQTITAHIEPALDALVSHLTDGVIRKSNENSALVVAYDTANLRLRQDRSKEAMEWYDRGVLKAEVALRETGFDPDNDMMDAEEYNRWLLNRIVSGSATPEQMQAAYALLTGEALPVSEPEQDAEKPAPGLPGRNDTPSLEDHPYEGPPREDHDHNPAPFSAEMAADEVLVLRALEKAGNIVLNSGKRGREKDRTTPPHMAHVTTEIEKVPSFDFSLAETVYGDLPAAARAEKERQLAGLCNELYASKSPYTRKALIRAVKPS